MRYTVKQRVNFSLLHTSSQEKKMLVNKTKAADLAGISRKSIHNHINEGRLSVSKDTDGSEKIDLSELKRVYGSEIVLQNLKNLEEEEQGVGNIQNPVQGSGKNSVRYDLLIVEEKLSNAEIIIQNKDRQIEQLKEHIETLNDQFDKTRQEHTGYLRLLEHNSESLKTREQQFEEKVHQLYQEKISLLQKTIQELKQQTEDLKIREQELIEREKERRKRSEQIRKQREAEAKRQREEANKSWYQKLVG